MNKSDARGEDDPGQREEELVCFMLRLKVSMVGNEKGTSSLDCIFVRQTATILFLTQSISCELLQNLRQATKP